VLAESVAVAVAVAVQVAVPLVFSTRLCALAEAGLAVLFCPWGAFPAPRFFLGFFVVLAGCFPAAGRPLGFVAALEAGISGSVPSKKSGV
jgi:hypothetical protein